MICRVLVAIPIHGREFAQWEFLEKTLIQGQRGFLGSWFSEEDGYCAFEGEGEEEEGGMRHVRSQFGEAIFNCDVMG